MHNQSQREGISLSSADAPLMLTSDHDGASNGPGPHDPGPTPICVRMRAWQMNVNAPLTRGPKLDFIFLPSRGRPCCFWPAEFHMLPHAPSESEYPTFYGMASPPTSYGGYGGNANEKPKYCE